MKAVKIVLGVLGVVIALAVVAQCAKNTAAQTPAQSSSTVGSGVSAPTMVAPSAPAAGPVRSVGEGGTYHVGEDIEAGSWKTTGPPPGAVMDMCVWQRAKDDSGEVKSVITSGVINGPTSVTVKAGEYFVLTGQCTWAKK